MDESVKADRELSWRRKSKPLTTYCGFPVVADARLSPDTAKLVHPDTGETLYEFDVEVWAETLADDLAKFRD